MSGIEAATFDVGGTLIAPWPSVGHVYAEGAARFGLGRFDPAELDRRFLRSWKSRGSFDYSQEAWCRIVLSTFEGLVPPGRGEELFSWLYQRFGEPAAWRIYDDVPAALNVLRSAGLRLGIISNWDERLPPLLEGLGLAASFDVIVVSFQWKVTKPDRRLFEQASRALGVEPERILHVGDSLEEDCEGARQAGLQAVHLDRARPPATGRLATLEAVRGMVG